MLNTKELGGGWKKRGYCSYLPYVSFSAYFLGSPSVSLNPRLLTYSFLSYLKQGKSGGRSRRSYRCVRKPSEIKIVGVYNNPSFGVTDTASLVTSTAN